MKKDLRPVILFRKHVWAVEIKQYVIYSEFYWT